MSFPPFVFEVDDTQPIPVVTDDPDIVLPTREGAIVGWIPGLRGREAVQQVIAELLGEDDE